MAAISRFYSKKISFGRKLSIVVPIISAIVLSFGNDLLSWYFMEENGLVDVKVFRTTMMFSNILLVFGLFFSILLSNILFRKMLKQELVEPFQKLTEGMSQMRKGNLNYRIDYEDGSSHYEIYEDFNEMITETKRLSIKASEVDEGRKQLLLNISHDLRSPLTSIIAYVQGLLDHVARDEATRERYLQTIKNKAIDIDKMVDRIFLFAKLDTNQYSSNPVDLPINEFVEEYILEKSAEDMEDNIKLTCKTEGNGRIHADPDILKSIFNNLLSNSIKYNDKEVIRCSIEVKEESHNIRIVFQDNGPGVKQEQLPHIWDLFYREDPSRNNPAKGSGIGLAIVKKAVEQMNGKVTASNGAKGGLVIKIRIPKIEN